MYFPWKSSFQMMLHNTAISSSQQLIYLRNFTTGHARSVVDGFSRRLYTDPQDALTDVWRALDKRFGNVAGITNAHLELLDKAARFNEQDTEKLQQFADVCANVDSQLVCLPGLASLNFPNVLHPVINKLPFYLRNKWEKIVSEYAETHNDAYTTFHVFCEMITSQCRLKNHPNIQVHAMDKSTRSRSSPSDESYPYTNRHETTRVLKSAANVNPSTKVKPKEQVAKNKYCPIHDSPNHDLRTCYVFNTSTLEKKTEFLRQTGICSRCLIEEHDAKECSADITCSKCLSMMHSRQLHIDVSSGTRPTSVNTACTQVCSDNSGSISCSKYLLLDVYPQNTPSATRRIYALLDDQSNVSLINSKLVDDLTLRGEQEKYNMSTCSGKNIASFGRRIHGLVVRSVVHAKEYILPSLLECDFIPNDKREVATPEMAKKFSHLSHIAREIPPYDANAEVVMVIGRDAPEMLKVREFKNGPVGAPWAQKHLLGWTISGQVCPDDRDEPIHVKAQKTSQDHAHDNVRPIVTRHSDNTRSQNNEVNEDNSVVTSKCETTCGDMSTLNNKGQSFKRSKSSRGTISSHVACGGIAVLLLIINPLGQVSPFALKAKLPIHHFTDGNTNVILWRENPLLPHSTGDWGKCRRDVAKLTYPTISHVELCAGDQNGESCKRVDHAYYGCTKYVLAHLLPYAQMVTTRARPLSTTHGCQLCRAISDVTQELMVGIHVYHTPHDTQTRQFFAINDNEPQ